MMQSMTNKNQSKIHSSDSSGARRASEESAEKPVAPNPEVTVKRQRRTYTKQYKLSIVEQANACHTAGEVGALLRREGLYSSSLSNWKKLYRQGALQSLSAKKRGPVPKPNPAELKQLTALEKKVAKLERELEKAHAIIDVQKKLSLILSTIP